MLKPEDRLTEADMTSIDLSIEDYVDELNEKVGEVIDELMTDVVLSDGATEEDAKAYALKRIKERL